ncbi:MAG: hypothetical protein ABJB03_10205 [Rhodoglobus sp.]
MRSPIKAAVTIAISIALAFTLGACSPLPSAGPTPSPTQVSVSAACDAIAADVKAVRDELNQAAEVLNANTTAAAEILKTAAFRLGYTAETLGNEKVSKLATEASDRLTQLSDAVTVLAGDHTDADVTAFDAAGNDVNAAINALAEVCPTPQSVSDACGVLQGEAAAVSGELSAASTLLSTDPTTGAGMLEEAAARFEKAAAAVENEQIRALAASMRDSLNQFSGLINTLAADPTHPDEDALTAGSNNLNAVFNALATVCAWPHK